MYQIKSKALCISATTFPNASKFYRNLCHRVCSILLASDMILIFLEIFTGEHNIIAVINRS